VEAASIWHAQFHNEVKSVSTHHKVSFKYVRIFSDILLRVVQFCPVSSNIIGTD